MNFTELGPFEGMTYRGRQLFDTIVKESVTKREKLLGASTSREGEAGEGSFCIHVSQDGYATQWREYTSGQWVYQLLCFAGIIALGVFIAWLGEFLATDVFLTSIPRIGGHAYVLPVLLAAWLLALAFLAFGLCYELVTSLRLGFFKDSGSDLFKRLSAHSWIVGDIALYISERDEKSASTKSRTVFFDAIGSVYADGEKDIEALVLSARDGSEIARMPFPASDAGADGNEIAAAIVAKLRNSQPGAVAK